MLFIDPFIFLAMAMLGQGKAVLIENPLRSYLWGLPPYVKLLGAGCFDVCLQNCKFSFDLPSRPKWSRFRTNIPEFKTLGGPCRLTHEHLEWGKNSDGTFATAEEAAYPKPLCAAMASVVAQYINRVTCANFSIIDQTSIADADGFKKA